METNNLMRTEEDLFFYTQYLRLTTAKRIIETNQSNNAAIEGQAINNFFKKVKNLYQQNDKKINNTQNDLSCFLNKHKPISQDEADNIINTLFNEDKIGLQRLLFAIKVISDNEYRYEHNDNGLMEVSNILYNDSNKIISVRNELETSYKKICHGDGLSSNQKKIFIGVAAGALALSFIMPIVSVGGFTASGAATTSALAAAGFADMQVGVGMIALSSVLCAGAIIGGTYAGMKLYNNAKVKEAFKKLKCDEQNLYLSIECVVISHLKRTLSENDFKEELDKILKNVSMLKSDLDYFTFIEKENVIENMKRLKGFHGFDNRLGDILL